MKHLFIARHGHYTNDRLDEFGRQQMRTLAAAIKGITNGSSLYIVSSTAPRAIDSSEELAKTLGTTAEFEQMPYLWSGNDAPQESFYWDRSPDAPAKLLDVVNARKEKADALVITTHYEIVELLPSLIFEAEFGRAERFRALEKGHAAHIDLEQRTYQVLPKRAASPVQNRETPAVQRHETPVISRAQAHDLPDSVWGSTDNPFDFY